MTLSDCYRILKIPPGVTWGEVKLAYRNLAKRYHPDKGNIESDSGRFREISRAFQILEVKYKSNRVELSESEQRSPFLPIPIVEAEQANESGRDIKTIIEFFLLGSWKRFFHQTVYHYERLWFPLDLLQGVTVDRKTAEQGGVVRVTTAREIFDVKIPTGVRHGSKIRIKEKGGKSLFYDKRGDLYLKLRVVPNLAIKPGVTNLYYEMEICRQQLGFGKVFTLHTLQGPIKFFPPRTTEDGQIFILKARPEDPNSKKLNHILTINLV